MTKRIIIIGGGQAGLQVLASLRQGGFDGSLTLISEEHFLPYQRPPLSKSYLAGKMERDRLFLKPQKFYDENNIALHLGCRVQRIDPAAHSITYNGTQMPYDALVLATGSRPRPFPLRPEAARNIFNLRGIDDIDAMQPHFIKGENLVIIGGGYIGLEAAACARQMGLNVTLLEAAPRLLARVAEPEISEFYHQLHQAEAVRIITDCQIAGFKGAPDIAYVCLKDGTEIAADFVITGIGVLPNTVLAEAAGLDVEDGIMVDEHGRTSDPAIYAAGDCTRHPNALLQRTLRLESVPNAIEQAKSVAAHILDAPHAYAQIPWFWSDQYDVKLQIAGMPERIDSKIVRGDTDSRSFAWFYFTGTQLVGVMAVNRAAEFLAARQLIHRAATEGLLVDAAMLADPDCPPKSWLK